MPVELTEEALRDAVAVIGERGVDGAEGARSALEWIGWHGEGSLLLRRYDVQLFCWYTLPRKFLTSVEYKREAAAALAHVLEQLGGRAAAYAAICRSPDTLDLLDAWEQDERAAWPRFRKLLEGSGLEPPDTELLEWGSVMGMDEASAREQVAIALEEAIEDGRLAPGAPRFRGQQARVAETALQAASEGGAGPTWLELVHAERLRRWIGSDLRRREARSAVLQPIAELLAGDPPACDEASARDAVEPARWLLSRATDAIALTQTGALNRAFVREAVERWPGWWQSELFGPPNREDDVALLHELHALLRRLRLLRRRGRRTLSTARARALLDDPPAMLAVLAAGLLEGSDFSAACAELAAAAILDGTTIGYSDEIALRIQPAIVADGWHAGSDHPSVREVGWHVAGMLRPAEAIGLIAREPRETRAPAVFRLTEAGRAGLIVALRARALGPARGPW